LVRYILNRLLYLLPVLFLISVISFMLIYLSPGDPIAIFLSKSGDVPDPTVVEAMRADLGLDAPILTQYVNWITNILHGNFGNSITDGSPVLQEILQRFPNTLLLTLLSMLLTLVISVPLGILSAVKENSMADNIIRVFAFVDSSMPGFFMALLLIYLFSIKLQWLPTISVGNSMGIVLPTLTLALCLSASYIRQIRAAIIKELGEEYIKMARARGVKERLLLYKGALHSSMPALLTLVGLNIGHLLGGTSIIEMIFSYPGVGKLAVQAIADRDYPMIQGYVLLIALVYVMINLIVDITHAFSDPRVRYKIILENRRLLKSTYETRDNEVA
jgi:peptide/nickel transport system permease protein